MKTDELEKGVAHITVEIIEYITNAVVIKTILKKSTGNISVISSDSGEGISERTSPFDTFAQVIDGSVEMLLGELPVQLATGQSIILPAHQSTTILPNQKWIRVKSP
jgi:quercetin dioxygenase-like cupin family protein